MTEPDPPQPFANTKTAQFINQRIENLKSIKSQREIAFALGYSKPNILSMIKRGETKMPLDKIPALADAIGADPAHLFRLALEDYLPAIGNALDKIFGRVATENEWKIFLGKWRVATGNTDPAPSPEIEITVDTMLTELNKARQNNADK